MDETYSIPFELRAPSRPHDDTFDHDYAWYIEKQRIQEHGDLESGSSSQLDAVIDESDSKFYSFLPTTTLEEYENLKAAHLHEYAHHPLRTTAYNLLASPSRDGPLPQGDWRDLLYLEWLRNLSNVSNLLRKELADVVWTKAQVRVDTIYMQCIPALLEDRPKIHSRIKYLWIDFNYGCASVSTLKPIIEEFGSVCDQISPILKLDELSIFLDMEEREVDDIMNLFRVNLLRFCHRNRSCSPKAAGRERLLS